MSELAEAGSILASKNVWIIDDDIPIAHAKFKNDDLISGKRPIDRGSLLALLAYVEWADTPVKALCEQLINQAKSVTAFTQPAAALHYLEQGAQIPDVVVYDLVYATLPTGGTSIDSLQKILDRCVCVVQIYTQEPSDEFPATLNDLVKKYDWRVGKPLQKVDTDAQTLANLLDTQLQKSLSARLASTIRQSSSKAIEEVLVKIDGLPVDVTLRLLTSQLDSPEESELVEMLSVKVTEALESSKSIEDAVRQYILKKGIAAEESAGIAQEIVALLIAHTREKVSEDGLFDQVRIAWESAKQGTTPTDNDAAKKIIKQFFAFRLYSRPSDDIVRTGDVIALSPENTDDSNSNELFLILTPQCDLAKFWKKTRGSLTYARMLPIDNGGKDRLLGSGNQRYEVGNSITANLPMVLPSIPASENEYIDYVLFPHEITVKILENNNDSMVRSLRYSELGNSTTRKCRISEPFLAGILAEVESTLFRLGIPDYPKEEKARIKKLLGI